MSESEVKAKLERALHRHRPIAQADWRFLKRTWYGEGPNSSNRLVRDAEEDWNSFRDSADDLLRELERRDEDKVREQAGELSLETEVSERAPEPPGVPDILAPLSERTAARAGALSALDQLRLGPNALGGVMRDISSRVRPQGGFDETLPQWVIELEIEAWVPADDVRNIYRHVQRDLLAEEACPKTQPRTYNVARFVWEERLRDGKRPSWPVLLERWKERYPDDEGFTDWRAFHKYFKRGEKATPPRYAQSNDYIASEARRLRQLKERWEEGPWMGLRP